MQSGKNSVLWSDTSTMCRPSVACFARTNSSIVRLAATDGRWKCPKMMMLIKYLACTNSLHVTRPSQTADSAAAAAAWEVNLSVRKVECFSLDMPSDLWRKRVTKFESKFTDSYDKVWLFFVYFFCCILCLLYFMLLLP